MIEINFGILAAQVVTFLIGAFLLWKIAWGPLTEIMQKRRQKIQDNIDSAQKTKEEVEQLKEKYLSDMTNIEKKAAEIISKAKSDARKIHENIMKEATAEASAFTERTKKYLDSEKEKMLEDLRQEVARLAVAGAEKILRKTIDESTHRIVVEELVRELEKGGEI